jgi:hypothetical protein
MFAVAIMQMTPTASWIQRVLLDTGCCAWSAEDELLMLRSLIELIALPHGHGQSCGRVARPVGSNL